MPTLIPLLFASLLSLHIAAKDWTPPYSRNSTQLYTIEDLDDCKYPSLEDVSVDLPEDPNPRRANQTFLDANIYMWHGLNMDKWIDKLVENCPAMLNTTCDNGKMCKFEKVLGRLMVGNSNDAHASPQCTQNRCSWESLGKYSNRGRIAGPDNNPNILLRPANSTAAALKQFSDQVLAYRRWYTLQAHLQLWEYYSTMDGILSDAALINTNQINTYTNAFMSEHKDATTSLDNIFDIISAVASLTPWGDAVNLLLDAVKLGKDAVEGGPKKVASGSTFKAIGGDVKTILGENRKVMGKRIANIAWVAQDIGKISALSMTVPATDVAPVSVKVAEMGNFMGELFLQLKSNWQKARDDTLNGDPIAPGGYLTLVKGGLYSGLDGMDPGRADTARRQMTDYIQDKILAHIFQKQQLWIYKRTYAFQPQCERTIGGDYLENWQGEKCIKEPNGWRYILYIPVAGQATMKDSNELQNTYTAFDDGNFKNLPRATGKPLTIEDIFLQSTKCANIINSDFYQNGNSWPKDRKLPNRDGADPVAPTWSSEIGDSVNPLEDSCHWSVPVLDLDQQTVMDICCLRQQRMGQQCYGCTDWMREDHEGIYTGKWKNTKGPALYFGRQIFYPSRCAASRFEEWTHATLGSSYYDNYNRCMNPRPERKRALLE